MTEWFRRKSDKIKTFDKRDTKQGQWQKCPSCSEVLYYKSLEKNNFICTVCTYHFRISSSDYFKLLLDSNDVLELADDISSIDHLELEGVKKYSDQIESAKLATNLSDAIKDVETKERNSPIIKNKIIREKIDLSIFFHH